MKYVFIVAMLLTIVAIYFFFQLFQFATEDLKVVFKKEELKINELGDFLSGLFSPIAFLWLIITMFMQKNELELQRKSVDAQLEEMKETRKILTGESNFLRESTEFQKEVLILQRINTLRDEIRRKSELLTDRYREIDRIKDELALESIIRYLRTSIETNEFVDLGVIRSSNTYIDLTKLIVSYNNTVEMLSVNIFFESLIEEFYEIENVLRGKDC
ncbi:hypothetical protein [uncultured Roseibium sp.]|uniref:hypothetical protein n=1 Tax=uncultured Roseibium sp. TaxID=1936171 RepID=UPI00261D4208|nr:hypothetical protein [uncultured Roseibium sp.]